MSSTDRRKKIIVAGAGTGKTTLLRDIAVERCTTQNVLYLTYTHANACEFEAAVVDKLHHLPASITVTTWFSFLLEHGVRPFPAQEFTHRVDQMLFNNQEPRHHRGITRGMEEYFCPVAGVIYRSSLADLAVYCNEQWNGAVINRICGIYDVILVDEAQDFAGYDYDFILAMMDASTEMVVVGDPRQQTYRTGWKAKNRTIPHIFDFFEHHTSYELDTISLSVTHRCSAEVMSYANLLYSEYPQVVPSDERRMQTKGKVTVVKKRDFNKLISSRDTPPTALIWSKNTKGTGSCRTMNMGDSKGLTLDDVALFATDEMKKWIEGKPSDLKPMTKAKFYVALTRARGDLFLVV